MPDPRQKAMQQLRQLPPGHTAWGPYRPDFLNYAPPELAPVDDETRRIYEQYMDKLLYPPADPAVHPPR